MSNQDKKDKFLWINDIHCLKYQKYKVILKFRLSARIAAEVSLWLCDLFNFSDGAAYCHDDTREGKLN